MVDTTYARVSAGDARIYAQDLDAAAWRSLQVSYQVGQLLMPCCDAPAIPKTSPLGLQFFAHASGACASSPESQWHQAAKEAVAAAAKLLGYRAVIEHPGADGWRADVWIDVPGRPVAVELQHSYQHLRDYLRRQQRYAGAGVACMWLVLHKPYLTLTNACFRHRWKEELNRPKSWPEDQGVLLRDLPAFTLRLDNGGTVHGPDMHAVLPVALQGFCEGRYQWVNGRWLLDGIPIKYPLKPAPL